MVTSILLSCRVGKRLALLALTPLAAAVANKSSLHSQAGAGTAKSTLNLTSTNTCSSSGDSSSGSSSSSGAKGLFKDDMQTINYAIYRPDYPDLLYDRIFKYSKTASFDSAADLATGSGQAAKALAKKFTSVVGIDVSVQQLQNAGDSSNIIFKVGSAEDTKLPSSSLDLVTVAQALHWFDLPSFYAEANRVLRKDASLAVWGYDAAVILPREGASQREAAATAAANRLLLAIYNDEPLGPHWDARRRLVDSHYVGLEPRPPLFYDVQRFDGDISIIKEVALEDLVGYVRTWSSYTTYMKKYGVQTGHADRDPAEVLHRELLRVYRVDLTEAPTKVLLSWPLFLVLATCSK